MKSIRKQDEIPKKTKKNKLVKADSHAFYTFSTMESYEGKNIRQNSDNN